MKLLKNQRVLYVAFLIEVICAVIFAAGFFQPKIYEKITPDRMTYTNGNYDENGIYIDESYEAGRSYFVATSGVNLKRGVYNVVIHYDTNAYFSNEMEGNFIECIGSNAYLHSLEYDNAMLSPEEHLESIQVWAKSDVKDFQVVAVYCGRGSFRVREIEIQQSYAGVARNLFFVVFISILVNFGIVLLGKIREHRIRENDMILAAVLTALTAFLCSPCMVDYLIGGDDIYFHLFRIEGMREALLSGQFPVKIQPTQINGYGFAASVFYGDLFLYIPAFMRIIGFSIQESYAWYICLVNIATVLVSFFSFKGIFKDRKCALFGTTLYTLSLYRIVNLYRRSAAGEYTAMVFLPLLAYGLYRLFTDDTKDRKYRKVWIVPVLAYTGVIQSHLVSTEMVAIVSVLLAVILIKKVFEKQRFAALVKVVAGTILLNLGFLVPFADYYINKVCNISRGDITSMSIQSYGVYFANLFTIFANGSGSIAPKVRVSPGMYGETSLTPGIALMVCFLLFGYFFIAKKESEYRKIGVVAWIISLITLAFSLNVFPWQWIDTFTFGVLKNLQFAWRFLSIASISLTIVAMSAYMILKENFEAAHYRMFVGVVAVVAVLTAGYTMDGIMQAEQPFRIHSYDMLRVQGSGTVTHEYAPNGVENASYKRGVVRTSSDEVTVSGFEKIYGNIQAFVNNGSGTEGYVELPEFYFPGFRAFTDDGELECGQGEYYVVRVQIPAGFSGTVKVRFVQPLLWKISYVISVLTFIGILIVWTRKIKTM